MVSRLQGNSSGCLDGIDGTDEAAELASDAVLADEVWLSLAVETDSLMSAVGAGDEASSTSDAPVVKEDGVGDGRTVEFGRSGKEGNLFADQGIEP